MRTKRLIKASSGIKTDFNGKEIVDEAGSIQVNENNITFDIKPWEIITLEVHKKPIHF